MSQDFRLAEGGLIDRERHLHFKFDGRRYTGFAGDSLAAALLANGVRLVGRSFKYHRPRGVVTCGSNEPNALVELRTGARKAPNMPATTIELYEGLVASSQNRWPSVNFDLLSVNNILAPVFVAGFYYKTFMWPASWWEPVYERFIRRAAGLGRASGAPDPDRYERANLHCDVLVVGGGPAGLAAALTAGRAGARVVICDEGPRLGGSLLSERIRLNGEAGWRWAGEAALELAGLPNVRVMTGTTVFGYYDHNTLGAVERVGEKGPRPPEHMPRERMWHIDAGQVVIAAGALERPIVFTNNDLPGVMLASAARGYVNRYAVRPGSRAVVFGNNEDIYATADDLTAGGVEVVGVVDSRAKAAQSSSHPVYQAQRVVRALGWRSVTGVELGDGTKLNCDLVAVAGGWNPAVHLSSQTGVRPVWNSEAAAFLPGEPRQAEASVGAAAGYFATSDALDTGAAAGKAAAEARGRKAKIADLPVAEEPRHGGLEALWYVPGRDKRSFIDLQHDVTVSDVKLAEREGYRSVEHMKRYTTLGMATDQGKTANIPGLAILAEARGQDIPEVGTTVFRPPYTPVSLGVFAGYNRQQNFQPVRRSPLHEWGEAHGAVFMEAGPWMRIQAFPRDGEDIMAATNREVEGTRRSVGMCDVSTLGRIDLQGPDVAEFLNRLYCNGWKTLPVGKARYGLMLREDGIVFDDGTTSRLGENHYLMTTTTGQAPLVMTHMEYCHQVLWPELDVTFVSVSDQWAGVAVAGPKSRAVLQKVFPEADLSNEAFPFLAAGEFDLGGLPARLFRITFSGELGYELNVPADYGPAVADLILEAGEEFGITPYGLEALDVMRIEKGHVTHADLDGRVTAADAGFGKMMSTKKDYIGRRLAERPAFSEARRPRFVGLRPVDRNSRLHAGAHLLPQGTTDSIEHDEGYISSAAYSPTLGHWIALGFLANGHERLGEVVRMVDLVRGLEVPVEVVSQHFVDPEGERQNA